MSWSLYRNGQWVAFSHKLASIKDKTEGLRNAAAFGE